MVYEPQSPQQVLLQRRTAHLQQLHQNQQQLNPQNFNQQQHPVPHGPVIGPGAMHMFRKPPVSVGDVISTSISRKNLMRQVSGLGMEDPVFRTSKDDGSPEHPSNIFDDMSFSDVPEDMRDLVSIVSDPTAIRGVGLDVECYEQVLMKPYVDPNPEIEQLGMSDEAGLAPAIVTPSVTGSVSGASHSLVSSSQHNHNHPTKFTVPLVQIDPHAPVPPPRHPSPLKQQATIMRKQRSSVPVGTTTTTTTAPLRPIHGKSVSSHHPTGSNNMHESACTLQSLDLEGVFGKERVHGTEGEGPNNGDVPSKGVPSVTPTLDNSSSSNSPKQQQAPASSLHRQSAHRHPGSPTRSRQGGGGGVRPPPTSADVGDPLLYEAALAMQQQAGSNNVRLVQKVLNQSASGGMNDQVLDRPSNHGVVLRRATALNAHSHHSRTGLSHSNHNQLGSRSNHQRFQQQQMGSGYSDHLRTSIPLRTSRQQTVPNQVFSTATMSQHGPTKNHRINSTTGAYRVSGGSSQHQQSNNCVHNNNLDGGAIRSGSTRNYRPPPSTHSRKKKDGPRRRSMPTMSNIFPLEEQQEGSSQPEHTEESSVQTPQQNCVDGSPAVRGATVPRTPQTDINPAGSSSNNEMDRPEEEAEAAIAGKGVVVDIQKSNSGTSQSRSPTSTTAENTSLAASSAETNGTAPTASSGTLVSPVSANAPTASTTTSTFQNSFYRSRSHSPTKRANTNTKFQKSNTNSTTSKEKIQSPTMMVMSESVSSAGGNSSLSSLRSGTKNHNQLSAPPSPTGKVTKSIGKEPSSPRKISIGGTGASSHRGVRGFLSNAFRRSTHGGR